MTFTFDPSLQMGSASYSYSGNRATKTSADGWTGAARTADITTPTATLEFPAYSTGGSSSNFYLGTSTGTHSVYDETLIKYGIYFYGTDARMMNNGTVVNTEATLSSDVWKMVQTSTDVKYYKNDELNYTDTTTVPTATYYGAGGAYFQNKYGEISGTGPTPSSDTTLLPPPVAWI